MKRKEEKYRIVIDKEEKYSCEEILKELEKITKKYRRYNRKQEGTKVMNKRSEDIRGISKLRMPHK